MSNELSIACVTRALRNRLNSLIAMDFSALPADMRPTHEVSVTALPLDRVRKEGDNTNQVNLFLYQAGINPAWRNRNVHAPAAGDLLGAPLPLDLRYILTVYAEDDNELIAHVLFGAALEILHDDPLLSREELENALALSELSDQVERVRITQEPLSLEDTSRLWTGFQSDFRLSAAYHVSLVLIDSSRPLRVALPVLRIGSDGRGAAVVPLSSPSLSAVRDIFVSSLLGSHSSKPAAELGDRLLLSGANLTNEGVSVLFSHRLLPAPLELAPEPSTRDDELGVDIPGPGELASAPGAWPIGVYAVSLRVVRPSLPPWTTNQVTFALVPTLTSLSPLTISATATPFDLTVTCVPQIREKQKVALLVGDSELGPESVTTPAGDMTAQTTLVFHVPALAVGSYVVRLRVDGVDSLPVNFSASPATPLSFNPTQIVSITP